MIIFVLQFGRMTTTTNNIMNGRNYPHDTSAIAQRFHEEAQAYEAMLYRPALTGDAEMIGADSAAVYVTIYDGDGTQEVTL
jgi:hypothetical protein